jgi:cystathionine beta-lyase/cystathionine gamma-synthase
MSAGKRIQRRHGALFILNELGEERSEYFNSIAPPIIQTSNFAVRKVEELRNCLWIYSGYLQQGVESTLDILRKKLAGAGRRRRLPCLQQRRFAILCSVMANVKVAIILFRSTSPIPGAKPFDKILPRFGVTTTYVDGRQIENFERAILPHTS